MAAQQTVLYPGSFDPFHLGHLDVAAQAASIFGRVVVAVMHNPEPTPPGAPRWEPSPNLLGLSRVLVPVAVVAALAMVLLDRPVLFTLLCAA